MSPPRKRGSRGGDDAAALDSRCRGNDTEWWMGAREQGLAQSPELLCVSASLRSVLLRANEMSKKNPLNLNALQLKTLVLLQELARLGGRPASRASSCSSTSVFSWSALRFSGFFFDISFALNKTDRRDAETQRSSGDCANPCSRAPIHHSVSFPRQRESRAAASSPPLDPRFRGGDI